MSDHNRRTALLALGTVAVVVAWLLTARLLAPPFIEHAYHGTAPTFVSDLLPRRARLPLEHYLARADRLTATIAILLAIGGAGLVAVSRPRVQRLLGRWQPPPAGAAGMLPMSRRRRAIATAVVVVAVGGHLFDIVTGTEHWPFSHYGMFSAVAPRQLSARLELYGVSETGDVALDQPGYVEPLDDQRIRGSIQKLRRRRDASAAIERALRYAGTRYEQLRRQGAHAGPPIVAVKLVEASWKHDAWAQNRDAPDSVRVLYEVRIDRDAH